ncbi:hypothetical protein E6C60_2612 [Paenibacillus algicola]|uniref:Uncharacterized protein n=1 Tax=Paenibacillus algicola TaxID=2565926 RepID=A0A4V1G436_9BACL|nr:hypothetical protein [Paenibacillus algicola]QCT03324.1 hypothetical protein E6C60_2612 [Paenibacillus algicola]
MNRQNVADLLGELQQAAFWTNENTDFAVFIRYSGHAHLIAVQICESKESTKAIFNNDIWISHRNSESGADKIRGAIKLLKWLELGV